MTVSIPDALRAVAWLLVPEHFLALYAEQVLAHFLALVGVIALARLALRRYASALAALALVATLTTLAPRPERHASAVRRPPFAQRRVVHPAHAPRPQRTPSSRPAPPATAPPDGQPSRGTVCTAPRPAPVDEHAPAGRVPRQTRALSESELVALANQAVIGPLIEACRQAAGGAR